MEYVTDWRAWQTAKYLLVAASVGVFAGLMALVIPVSVSNDGSTVGCGNGFIRDDSPAENYSMRYSGQGWADILGYEYRGPRTSWSPYKDCTDALTTRRWVGWLLVVGGLGAGALLARQLINQRSARPSTMERTSEADSGPTYFRVDQGTGTLTSEETFYENPADWSESIIGSPDAPRVTGTQTHTLPAAWYPDQTDPTLVRWFDGRYWTDATLPAASNPDTGEDPR
ncbi:DUF2510 domain-containing protein [Prescottella agglutinans]|uniref:DUF2510 domain-containing protein n=1 Tax=Prescottella agglutinans TaxID=1644129 RepID=A0ABT6MKU0_9NOCA|nr:DUF2510 domain-containing protein [Prescottella agglutinans]MDH6284941.1 hypothetical protein [Prescottella agglutinans]